MKIFTFEDKYLKRFENEVKSEFYKKCLEILENNNSYTLLYNVLGCLENVSSFIDTVDITNDFIDFLYKDIWPIMDFESVKSSLKDYINEKIGYDWVDGCEDTPDYTFYKANRIWMENFYGQYYGKTLQLTFHRFNREKLGPFPNFEIKWSETKREAMFIIFKNKTYAFNLFYEKSDVVGLHFWRLNEGNYYERVSLIPSLSMYEEIDILEREFFHLDYMYIWTANKPGDITSDSEGTTGEWYTLV